MISTPSLTPAAGQADYGDDELWYLRRVLFGLIAAAMGVWMLWWSLSTTARIRASASWPAADGEIIRSVVARDSSRIRGGGYNHYFRAEITYRYQVAGKPYESDTFTFGTSHTFHTQAEAEAEVAFYAVGRHVEVRYDPSDPATSSVRPGTVPDTFKLITWMAAAFALAGMISLLSGIFSFRKRRSAA